MSSAFWIRAGAILGGLAVAAGAFGAHGLKSRVSAPSLEIFETTARYQMYHALALLAVGILARMAVKEPPGPALAVAGWCFVVGTLIFSGTLYGLVLTGKTWLGAITPIGGTLLIVGWVALAAGARRG
jgi:uncharacterized membrane protein YgdD (TMEM256/DUF423 family)